MREMKIAGGFRSRNEWQREAFGGEALKSEMGDGETDLLVERGSSCRRSGTHQSELPMRTTKGETPRGHQGPPGSSWGHLHSKATEPDAIPASALTRAASIRHRFNHRTLHRGSAERLCDALATDPTPLHYLPSISPIALLSDACDCAQPLQDP